MFICHIILYTTDYSLQWINNYSLCVVSHLLLKLSNCIFTLANNLTNFMKLWDSDKMILYTAIMFSVTMSCRKTSLSVISIIGIFAASLAVVALGEFRISSIAQAQGNITSSSLTPEQKAAVCAPGDTHVNATESKICGIPMTPSSNSTSSENATAGAETPSSPPTAAAPSTGE